MNNMEIPSRTADPATKLGHVPSTIFISDMDVDNDSVTQNDNTVNLAPDNEEAVRRIEEQMVELKIELANAKSSEDCLKLELSKLRVAFEQVRQENERLRLLTGQQGGEVHQTHIIPTKGVESGSYYNESANTYMIETGKRISTSSNKEMLYHGLPSCASGIAFLSGNFLSSATLHSLVPPGSIDGSVCSGRQPNLPRLPSCASAIALLYHSYSNSSISSLMSGTMDRKYSQLSLKHMAEARENGAGEAASIGGASSVASSSGAMSRRGSKKSAREEDWDFFTIVEE